MVGSSQPSGLLSTVVAAVIADVVVVVVLTEAVESDITTVVVEVGTVADAGVGGCGVGFSCGRAICAQDNLLVAGVFDFAAFGFGF